MLKLVVVYGGDGMIRSAGVFDIANIATYQDDKYLVYGDGRRRPLEAQTALYDVGPWCDDVLAWWRLGKYYVDTETGDLVEDVGFVYEPTTPTPGEVGDEAQG